MSFHFIFGFWFTNLLLILLAGCATPGQMGVKTPQGNLPDYPPTLTITPERQQVSDLAWRTLMQEHQLPETLRCDCDPVLLTPRALPVEAAGRIQIVRKVPFTDLEAKESLRHFIEIHARLLGTNAGDTAIGQPELSLISFNHDGAVIRITYQQRSFSYPLAEDYGRLEFSLSKTGHLLQWRSSLLPDLTLPAGAKLDPSSLPERFVGREFSYTNIAGQPMRYRVTRVEDVFVKETVVYPKITSTRLTLHLAFPIVVGAGTTWTIYVDAMSGEELAIKPNFVA